VRYESGDIVQTPEETCSWGLGQVVVWEPVVEADADVDVVDMVIVDRDVADMVVVDMVVVGIVVNNLVVE